METGRVIKENKTNYIVANETGEFVAVVRGKFHGEEGGFPKVGDYVEMTPSGGEKAVIERVLPRVSKISRRAADGIEEQVIVANVDVIFVVMGLDGDFNLKRLDRYMLLAEQSGITPVIVLNKSDAADDPESFLAQVAERFPQVQAHLVSAKSGANMEALQEHLGEGITAVLLGSSGAGKSTISNWLLGRAAQETGDVRTDDSRGRHTTTARQLFMLPSGGSLIDTPGMRELGVLGEVEGDAFAQIESLALACRFSDCDHEKSAGCAIRLAIERGELSQSQLESYFKLKKEKEYLESKIDPKSAHERREKARTLHRQYNQIKARKFGKR